MLLWRSWLDQCPGIGERKVKRLYDTIHEPFERPAQTFVLPDTPDREKAKGQDSLHLQMAVCKMRQRRKGSDVRSAPWPVKVTMEADRARDYISSRIRILTLRVQIGDLRVPPTLFS